MSNAASVPADLTRSSSAVASSNSCSFYLSGRDGFSEETALKTRILYYCTAADGGIADHTHALANAMCTRGAEVTVMAPAEFHRRADSRYKLAPPLSAAPHSGIRVLRRLQLARTLLSNIRQLTAYISAYQFSTVLFASYMEYLAPLWAGYMRDLAASGCTFGAIVHDPVRDHKVGPAWWHRMSVRDGYSFLREAFVHEPIELDTIRRMPGLCTTVIPHGPFRFPPASQSREEVRSGLAIPCSATVALSFGQIRDGKNLDRFLRAMPSFPNIYLLVAGTEALGRSRPAAYYQELAQQLGVASRCRWLLRYIPEEEVAPLFEACDFVLLTYSRKFRSASGVLNTAVSFRRPCLMSAGEGNLRTVVSKYSLGIWVEPDSDEELCRGLTAALGGWPTPNWGAYAADNSWERAADLILGRFQEHGLKH